MTATLQGYPRPVAGGEIDTVRALLHDLRQPLAAILLLSATEGGNNARKMELIESQARWLADLVETVLVDASEDDAVSTDLTTLVHRTVDRAQVTASCPIKIDVVGAPQAWARPVALGRALACVLDNAVRAAGVEGHVTVAIHTDGAGVHLTVRDDGPGLGRIASVTSLGLTTTRAMVAACKGSFRLYTADEGGVIADICLASPVPDREALPALPTLQVVAS